jgi:hypothetical protein
MTSSVTKGMTKAEKQAKFIRTMEQIRDELLEAFKTIFPTENWCKRAMCRDAEGEQLFDPNDPKAVQWCLLGSLYRQENWSTDTLTFLTNYARMRGIEDLSRYNDQDGHTAVVMLLVEVLGILGVEMKFFDDDGNEVATL